MAKNSKKINMAMSEKEWIDCINAVSKENTADIYVISGGLNNPTDDDAIQCIKKYKTAGSNAFLVLTTFGGDADVAYRIARYFQQIYVKENKASFKIFVPDICKSAGTLIALGATELVMDCSAQLGPLDVQLFKPDEIGKDISGLTPVQSLDFLQEQVFNFFEYNMLELIKRSSSQITTKTASEISTKLAVGLFESIYSQLDPLRLGEYHRNMMIADEYGVRLNEKVGNLRRGALYKLTHGYPSHGFVIDREEAKALFNHVRPPSEQEIKMVEYLRPKIYNDLYFQAENGQFVARVDNINPQPHKEDDSAGKEKCDAPSGNNKDIQPATTEQSTTKP